MLRLFSFLVTLAYALPASAQTQGPKKAFGQAFDNLTALESTILGEGNQPLLIEEIVAGVIQVALGLVGIIFVGLMLYGGYLWGTARGNQDRVETARKLIFESTIGIIIIFGAYFLTAFVVQQIGEVTLRPSL